MWLTADWLMRAVRAVWVKFRFHASNRKISRCLEL